MALGDRVLADGRGVARVLDRFSLLQRRAAGTGTVAHLIAANVYTMVVVTSCNADFNEGRLERYLVLAHSAGITPVVVLTKADIAAAGAFLQRGSAGDSLRVCVVGARCGLSVRSPAWSRTEKVWTGTRSGTWGAGTRT